MRIKNVLTVLLLLILSSFIVAGTTGDVGHLGEVFGYGSSPFKNVDYSSSFTKETLTTSDMGHYSVPIVCDIEADYDKELITFTGNNLYIYKINAEGFVLNESKNLGTTIKQVACVPDPFSSTRRKQIMVITADDVRGYDYSSGLINDEYETFYTFNSSVTTVGQPVCNEFTNTFLDSNDFDCIFGADDTRIFYIDSNSTQTDESFETNESHYTSYSLGFDYQNEFIYFVDDTRRELRSIYTYNKSNIPDSSLVHATGVNRYFNKPLSNYARTTPYTCGTAKYNGDFVSGGNGVTNALVCINNNATLLERYVTGIDSGTQADISRPVFYDIDLDTNIDVCVGSDSNQVDNSNTYNRIQCYDMSGTSTYYSTGVIDNGEDRLLTIGNLQDIDVPYFMFLSDGNIVGVNSLNTSDIVTVSDLTFYNIYFTDINDDGRQEIVGQDNTNFVLNYLYSATVDEITYDDGLIYDGLYGFYNPTCTDTLVTIKAKECTSSFDDCTYYNNNDDEYTRERLCTDCAGTETYFCGNWSYTSPQVNCQFSTTGDKLIDVNLETDTLPNETAADFDPFTLTVSDTECDESTDYVDVSDPNIGGDAGTNETTDDGTDDTTDDRSTADKIMDNIFILIGLAMTVAVLAGMAFEGVNHPLPLGIIAVGMTIFFGIISWYPIEYVILLLVGMIALGLLGLAFGRRGD